MKEHITTIIITCSWARGGEGGRKRAVPAISVDTLWGGRKGDPQHQVVGKTVGGEDSKHRCVVKVVFQLSSLYQKRICKNEGTNNTNNKNVFLGPLGGEGGRKKTVPAISVDTLRGRRKGDPQHQVIGKTVGGEDSKHRCVVKVGFQKTSL